MTKATAVARLAALFPPMQAKIQKKNHPDDVAPGDVLDTPRWCLGELAGRLTELHGSRASAATTMAFQVVLDAQRRGEPAAWLTTVDGSFFPPDVAAGGVDLDALVVVRLREKAQIARAADQLARSGAFGLLVLDLGAHQRIPPAMESRLLGLAQKHEVAVLFLTEPHGNALPLGSLISLRAEAHVERATGANKGFVCHLRALKDKHRASGWTHEEFFHGPPGLY